MDESTREDVRRMTEGLTDQTTIEALSAAGIAAQNKRGELHEAAKKAAEQRGQDRHEQLIEAAKRDNPTQEVRDHTNQDREKRDQLKWNQEKRT
ncbi:Fc.00g036240.m01.CDS01 [Cosmosporella sp. VM-42]